MEFAIKNIDLTLKKFCFPRKSNNFACHKPHLINIKLNTIFYEK